MATVHDVAAYILHQCGRMTTWKLQKLVYYSQAWNLVWEESPLFAERIEAWANGPVCPDLYERHKGKFDLSSWRYGDPEQLSESERETVDAVLQYYGDKSAQWLSDLTHAERPWQEARRGLREGERGNHEIPLDAMAEYYEAVTASAAAH